jgi:hypothetical protein
MRGCCLTVVSRRWRRARLSQPTFDGELEELSLAGGGGAGVRLAHRMRPTARAELPRGGGETGGAPLLPLERGSYPYRRSTTRSTYS